MSADTPWHIVLVLMISTPVLMVYISVREEVVARHILKATQHIVSLDISHCEMLNLFKECRDLKSNKLLLWNPYIWTYKQMFKNPKFTC